MLVGISFLEDWGVDWTFPVLTPLFCFRYLLTCEDCPESIQPRIRSCNIDNGWTFFPDSPRILLRISIVSVSVAWNSSLCPTHEHDYEIRFIHSLNPLGTWNSTLFQKHRGLLMMVDAAHFQSFPRNLGRDPQGVKSWLWSLLQSVYRALAKVWFVWGALLGIVENQLNYGLCAPRTFLRT